jgi:hypothetical protein
MAPRMPDHRCRDWRPLPRFGFSKVDRRKYQGLEVVLRIARHISAATVPDLKDEAVAIGAVLQMPRMPDHRCRDWRPLPRFGFSKVDRRKFTRSSRNRTVSLETGSVLPGEAPVSIHIHQGLEVVLRIARHILPRFGFSKVDRRKFTRSSRNSVARREPGGGPSEGVRDVCYRGTSC